MSYVYIYYDPRVDPHEPIYVGKGSGGRIYDHLTNCNSNILLQNKIRKIKETGLEPIIEKYIDNIQDDEAYLIEEDLINKFGKIFDKTGTLCNFSEGGRGGRKGFKHSDETKKLLSSQRRGKKQTEKQYRANCERTISEESRKKISDSMRGRKRSPEAVEKGRIKNIGQKRSDETKKLLSEQRKGKIPSKEHIEKIKESLKKSIKHRKIKCLNNKIIYNSIKEASLDLGISEAAIPPVARGERKSHKGYKFIYID